MSLQYKDYYSILGVPRDADETAIKRAYRKLARQYHPDVSKKKGTEEKFKEISEAYDVLGDPEKKKRFDTLGSDWKNGQAFTPPSGFENIHFEFQDSGGGRGRPVFEGMEGGFSDFFEAMFGGEGRRGAGRRQARWAAPERGEDQEAEMTISLEEAYQGGLKKISLQAAEAGPDGRVRRRTQTYDVRIPPGTTEGSRIRLSGQGAHGEQGGEAGDLYIRIHIEPHARFRVVDHDIETDLPVSPWEAALGGSVELQTLDGFASMKIPAGVQSGQKIRLRERGLPLRRGQGRGDLLAVVKIVVPRTLTADERRLFEELNRRSSFNPRG